MIDAATRARDRRGDPRPRSTRRPAPAIDAATRARAVYPAGSNGEFDFPPDRVVVLAR